MANITKVYTPANIFQAPADVYINIVAPASSLTPTADANTLVLDASGQPTSAAGFHAGLVEAPTMPTITEKLNEIHADQFEMPVDVAFDSIEAEIDFVMKETNLTRLQTLLSSANLALYTALANSQALQIGGQADAAVTPVTVLAVAPNRAVAGKFVYWMLYKAFIVSAIALHFERAKESTYKLKFKAYADTTRVRGDELMQIVRTK
jgi:hypothetical protein